MANLKHLKFSPLIFRPSAPTLLQRCTFQLESLVWTGNGSEEELYASFLPSQQSLLHLNINSDSYSDRSALPDGLCQSITSIACSLSDFARVSAARRITALQVANNREDIAHPLRGDVMSSAGLEACLAALNKVQLLRLWALPRFHRITSGSVLRNITLLHVRNWTVQVGFELLLLRHILHVLIFPPTTCRIPAGHEPSRSVSQPPLFAAMEPLPI